MYTPKFNQVSDRAILIEAMRAYSFAILFGPIDSAQTASPHRATHLPLVVKDEGPARHHRRPLCEGKYPLAIPRQSRDPRRLPRPA